MITPRVQELLEAFDAGRDSFAEAFDRLKCTSEEFHAVLVAITPGATMEERCRLLRSLDGEDPTAFVIFANIYRRHMTKGQRAMTVAKIYPDTGKGGRGKKSSANLAETAGFSQRRLQQARTVLRFAPDLADGVLTGSTSLDEAYKTARERKAAASSEEGQLVALRS